MIISDCKDMKVVYLVKLLKLVCTDYKVFSMLFTNYQIRTYEWVTDLIMRMRRSSVEMTGLAHLVLHFYNQY